jgi:hypothetical protein
MRQEWFERLAGEKYILCHEPRAAVRYKLFLDGQGRSSIDQNPDLGKRLAQEKYTLHHSPDPTEQDSYLLRLAGSGKSNIDLNPNLGESKDLLCFGNTPKAVVLQALLTIRFRQNEVRRRKKGKRNVA